MEGTFVDPTHDVSFLDTRKELRVQSSEFRVAFRSMLSSTGFDGVYACGDSFGAEVKIGAKRLRQDGFRSPLEAALERVRWLKSCAESKEHAPAAAAEKGSSQEQLAAEAMIEMVAAAAASAAAAVARAAAARARAAAVGAPASAAAPASASVAPAVTQLFTLDAKEAPAPASTHKEGMAHIPREEQPRPRDPYPVRAANAGAWTAPNFTNIARAPVTSSAANTYDRDVEQPGRGACAQAIPAKLELLLNQERALRAAGAAQVIAQQGTAGTLEARFAAHVMRNYTPRPPDEFSVKWWVSCIDLHRQLKPLTPLEAEMWKPAYVKMLVMELFKNHPLFAGRPYSEWSKKLMNRDALAHSKGKTHVFHFCLERTNHTDHLHLHAPGVAATVVVRSGPQRQPAGS